MNSRKERRKRDRGRIAESCPVVIVLAALTFFAGCNLFNTDTTPPTCRITSPVDSSMVNGTVQIEAAASDSGGVAQVEFYADGSLVGTDSSSPYSTSWDVSGLTQRSWHQLSCIAYDLAGNKGYSDTVAVEVSASGQTSVYHGELDVNPGSHQVVWFDALVGDTLAGDVMVVTGGTLSSLMWLDNDNYQKYIGSQPYTKLFEQDTFAQTSMTQPVASTGRFYLVFTNAGTSADTCWARFVLE